MKQSYSHVLAPIRVGGHLLKNRIITAPSTIHSATNGEPYPTEAAMRFFEDRARAGAGRRDTHQMASEEVARVAR